MLMEEDTLHGWHDDWRLADSSRSIHEIQTKKIRTINFLLQTITQIKTFQSIFSREPSFDTKKTSSRKHTKIRPSWENQYNNSKQHDFLSPLVGSVDSLQRSCPRLYLLATKTPTPICLLVYTTLHDGPRSGCWQGGQGGSDWYGTHRFGPSRSHYQGSRSNSSDCLQSYYCQGRSRYAQRNIIRIFRHLQWTVSWSIESLLKHNLPLLVFRFSSSF